MRTVERICIEKAELRAMSDAQLAHLGVRMESRPDTVLECVVCGQRWSPAINSEGKLPFDYWVCPARCNRT